MMSFVALGQNYLSRKEIIVVWKDTEIPELTIYRAKDSVHLFWPYSRLFLKEVALPNYQAALQQKTADTSSYRYFWQPLTPYLRGVERVYWVGEGLFEHVNPSFFALSKRRYLAQKHLFIFGKKSKEPPLFQAKNYHANDWGCAAKLHYTSREIGLLREQAQKHGIKANENWAAESHFLHFSTHSEEVFDPEGRTQYMLLGCDSIQQAAFTNFIENSQLRLCEHVFLSSCESGWGGLEEEKSFLNLLQQKGVRRVLASTSTVNDRVAFLWSSFFYKCLFINHNYYKSIRKTQKKLSKSYHSPTDWAAFSLWEF